MNQAGNDNAFRRIVKTATKIEPQELTATLLSFAFVFILMAAYFILRPVRDAMASDWTDVEVARRWWNLYPKRRDKDGEPERPYEHAACDERGGHR